MSLVYSVYSLSMFFSRKRFLKKIFFKMKNYFAGSL